MISQFGNSIWQLPTAIKLTQDWPCIDTHWQKSCQSWTFEGQLCLYSIEQALMPVASWSTRRTNWTTLVEAILILPHAYSVDSSANPDLVLLPPILRSFNPWPIHVNQVPIHCQSIRKYSFPPKNIYANTTNSGQYIPILANPLPILSNPMPIPGHLRGPFVPIT